MSVRIGTSICSVETEETRAEDGILTENKKEDKNGLDEGCTAELGASVYVVMEVYTGGRGCKLCMGRGRWRNINWEWWRVVNGSVKEELGRMFETN